ncbi:signal transduction histidine kinase [Desulfitispora alkaliphila]|uniref:sensor histidine kinase n=1 Tax=Desulfitispora alkaliphila TaxID=622674 RepID=UPI003D1C17D3
MIRLYREFMQIPSLPKAIAFAFLLGPLVIRLIFPHLIEDLMLQSSVWRMHLLSAGIFSFYLGVLGGLLTATFTVITSLLIELRQIVISPETHITFIIYLSIELVTTFLFAIAVGVLSQKLKNKQKIIDEANKKLSQCAIVEERNRIARELHDGLAQALGFSNFKLKQISRKINNEEYKNEFKKINEVLDEAYDDVRQHIFGLKMNMELEKNFYNIVRNMTEKFQRENNIQVQVSLEGNENKIPFNIKVQMARVIQEALTNVRKHANAKKVKVSIEVNKDVIMLIVEDDGCGFSELNFVEGNNFGLASMKQRIELVEGEFKVVSVPGKGTTVKAKIILN